LSSNSNRNATPQFESAVIPRSKNARLFYRAAFQRIEDGSFLLKAGRTTAAVYLAGYGVECIIKSLILSCVPENEEAEILGMFRGTRAHDYEWLLWLYQQRGGQPPPSLIVPDFVHVNTWSTNLRCSPGVVKKKVAKAFIDSAGNVIEWADGRL
jgi:hypothetical protein